MPTRRQVESRTRQASVAMFVVLAAFSLGRVGPCSAVQTHSAPPSRSAADGSPSPFVGSSNSEGNDPVRLAAFKDYILKGQYDEVKPLLAAYLQAHPNSWQAHYDLGYVLFRIHDVKGSIRELSRSLELNIKNADAHKILGLDLSIIQRDDLAGVEFEQAVRLDPNSVEIHYFLARHYMTQQVFLLAKREFEATIKLDPTHMKAYDNLGLTMEALGDNQAALENYHKAVQLVERDNLDSEWPYTDLARFYNRLDNSVEAVEYAKKAVEKNPRAAQAYFELAKAYRRERQWNESAAALEKAIAIDPGSADYYYVLAYVYKKLGKAKESKDVLDTFTRLHDRPLGSVPSTRGAMGTTAPHGEPREP